MIALYPVGRAGSNLRRDGGQVEGGQMGQGMETGLCGISRGYMGHRAQQGRTNLWC